MSELEQVYSGYVCAPYLHNYKSIELKDTWVDSKNISRLYFVTGTFSNESKPYFADSVNHYLLAKFHNSKEISENMAKYNQDKTSFVFNIHNDLFSREVFGETNFVSVYYLKYSTPSDLQEIAHVLLKREMVEVAGLGDMSTNCLHPLKFTFPYAENIVVIEVASQKSHQSIKKYCDQTRRDVNRKGLTMTNLLSLSILEQLK